MTDNKTEEQNFDDLTLTQIAELARQEAGEAPVTAVADEPKPQRDDKGRFVKAEAEPTEPPVAPTTTVFRREIDLGDGSGKQVFEAPTVEALLDKLTTAQTNATRKIREQAEELRQAKATKKAAEEPAPTVSDDDEFVLSQQMMSRPSEAIKQAFKKMTGYDISEFKTVADRAKAFDAAQAQQADVNKQAEAGNAFIAEHPEYINQGEVGNRNNARFSKALNLLIAEAKSQGREPDYPALLEQAYSDLATDGLLVLRGSDDVTAEPDPTGAAGRRIGTTVEEVVSVPRKKASNLSQRSYSPVTRKAADLSVDDLYDLPLEQLKDLANRHMN